MGSQHKRPRSPSWQDSDAHLHGATAWPLHGMHKQVKRDEEMEQGSTEQPIEIEIEIAEHSAVCEKPAGQSAARDDLVAAILTIASALGLHKETLHICVDLLDRYLDKTRIEMCLLEPLSIACLWIAVKFMETPKTIAKHRIKHVLKRREQSGNWTWQQILHSEASVLKALEFRILAPTVLTGLQQRLHRSCSDLTDEQIQLAYYLADLTLLTDRANAFAKDLAVDAIWFIVTNQPMVEAPPALLPVLVLIFLSHRDSINPHHPTFKTWFALRCQYGRYLGGTWRLPCNPACTCRICMHVRARNGPI